MTQRLILLLGIVSVLLLGVFCWSSSSSSSSKIFFESFSTATEATDDSKAFSPPPIANFGVNTWRQTFDSQQKMFKSRFDVESMLHFPSRPSLTGEFVDDGPLASNA